MKKPLILLSLFFLFGCLADVRDKMEDGLAALEAGFAALEVLEEKAEVEKPRGLRK